MWRAALGLLRQPRIGVSILLVSSAVATATFFGLPTTYKVDAVGVLTTQTSGTVPQGPGRPAVLANPLLNIDSSLQTSVVILVQALSTPEVAAELVPDPGNGTTVSITDGSSDVRFISTNAPFIIFTGTSLSAAKAQTVVTRAEARVRQELADRQRSVNPAEAPVIDLIEVLPPSKPVPQTIEKVQVVAFSFVATAVVSLALVYAWMRLRQHPEPIDGVEPMASDEPTEVRDDDVERVAPAVVKKVDAASSAGNGAAGSATVPRRTAAPTAASVPGATPGPAS